MPPDGASFLLYDGTGNGKATASDGGKSTSAQAYVYSEPSHSTAVTPGLWFELDRESDTSDVELTLTTVDSGCTFIDLVGRFATGDLLTTSHQWMHTCVKLPSDTGVTGIGFRFDGVGKIAIGDLHFGPACP